MHEVVFSDDRQKKLGVSTGDMAKRLIDYGFHPYTVSFPLIVHGALMIEPTETESKLEIDQFIEAMISIAKEVETDPQMVKGAPYNTRTSRVDEVTAARKPVLAMEAGVESRWGLWLVLARGPADPHPISQPGNSRRRRYLHHRSGARANRPAASGGHPLHISRRRSGSCAAKRTRRSTPGRWRCW